MPKTNPKARSHPHETGVALAYSWGRPPTGALCNYALTQERPDIVPRERTGPAEELAAISA